MQNHSLSCLLNRNRLKEMISQEKGILNKWTEFSRQLKLARCDC